jgi:ATP-dependent DNA helicase DinG
MNFLNYFKSDNKPYPQQEDFLNRANQWYPGPKKFLFGELGTGTGKTHLIHAILTAVGGYDCVTQVSLGDQVTRDFKDVVSVYGGARYDCVQNGTDCRTGAQIQADAKEKPCEECPYREAKERARGCRAVVTTYHYLINRVLYNPKDFPVGGDEGKPVLILDEAHNFESILLDFFSLNLDLAKLQDLFLFRLDEKLQTVGSPDRAALNKLLFETLPSLIEKRVQEWATEESGISGEMNDDEKELVEKIVRVTDRYRENQDLWIPVIEVGAHNHRHLKLRPVTVANEAQKIFDKFDKVICFSATILDTKMFAKELGIETEDYEAVSMATNFPVDVRRVWLPTGNPYDMSYGKKDVSTHRMAEFISKVVSHAALKDQRGIIHTNSFSGARELIEALVTWDRSIKSRLIWHDLAIFQQSRETLSRKEAQEAHRQSRNGILISPSMSEGLNLADEDCRFCFVAKVPFLNHTDPYIDARARYFDAQTGRPGVWKSTQELRKLLQACGRGVRHESDACLTMILDTCFHRFASSCLALKIVPESFKEAVEYFDGQPWMAVQQFQNLLAKGGSQ